MHDSDLKESSQNESNFEPDLEVPDPVFGDLFSNPEMIRRLFYDLFPEHSAIELKQIENISLLNPETEDTKNILSFLVNDRYFFLIDGQTVHLENIVLSLLLYFADILKEFIGQKGYQTDQSDLIHLPVPHFIIAVPEEKQDKEILSLQKHFKAKAPINLEVEVITPSNATGILKEYLLFSQIVDEQRKIYGNTVETIHKAIKIAKERDILTEYLRAREKEIINLYEIFFNQLEFYRRIYQKNFEFGSKQKEYEMIRKLSARGSSPEEIAYLFDLEPDYVNRVLECKV